MRACPSTRCFPLLLGQPRSRRFARERAGPARRRDLPKAWIPALLLLGFVFLPEAGVAGTGQLLSPWMSRAPSIDGEIGAGEWSEAVAIDLGGGVTARVGNDGRTLYLMLFDTRSDMPIGGGRMILFFDDDGGTAPLLDDGLWTSPDCELDPALGEGEIWFEKEGAVDFYQWWTTGGSSGYCEAQSMSERHRSATGSAPGLGIVYEAALPLDGPTPLHALPGQRFGFQLRAVDDSNAEVCYPSCSLDPFEFRSLVLASSGCNTGPQDLGSGLFPQVGLPLDWTVDGIGGGPGWHQSTPVFGGDPALCQANVTGGTGAAACVANGLYTSASAYSNLLVPLPLAGQTSATVRLRAVFEVGSVSDLLYVELIREGGRPDILLFWQGQDQSADLVWPISFAGSLPVRLRFLHQIPSAGGIAGGYAQIDDVELLCGPILFADGFESGLTTHWSATAP